MKRYSGKLSFVSGLPGGHAFSFSPNLYNLTDHIALLEHGTLKTFHILDQNNIIRGLVNFVIENDEAVSLPQRPFGSFELDSSLSFDAVNLFVQWVADQLREMNISAIIIKSSSSIYNQPNFHKTCYALTSNGFKIAACDINHHIEIADASYEKIIDRQERKRLNKCIRNKFSFNIEPYDKLEEIYNFIVTCRNEKSQPISISLEKLDESIKAFPQRYVLFSARIEDKLAAASVSVKAGERILYDFMHANPGEFQRFSPVVFLVGGIYQYCKGENLKYIDLGISSFKNSPQNSLIRFKENIGGAPTVKLTFIKKLDR